MTLQNSNLPRAGLSVITILAAILASIAVPSPASADLIFTLTFDSCTGGCGNGQGTNNNNFGTIDLHQVDANHVLLTEQLNTGVALDTDFVNTGNGFNHEILAFNVINADLPLTITGISNPTFFTVGPAPDTISGLGTFTDTIACTASCPPGASGADLLGDSLVFTTSDGSSLSINDFINNGAGFAFASDVIGPSGLTGEVAAIGPGTPFNPVPEPTSLALLGTALVGFGLFRRRQRHDAV